MYESIIEEIKFNCDISDAKYWGFFSICGLLMRMRDLYRSEQNLKPWAPIGKDSIASWISKKEGQWPSLERAEFKDIVIDGEPYQPFDVSGINHVLNEKGFVYGAGYGISMKPVFFLAELQTKRKMYDFTVYSAGREHARDLFASPAMLQGRCIFLRLETLEGHLWDKLLEMKAKKDLFPRDVLSEYGISLDGTMDEALYKKIDHLTRRYSRFLIYHELGEAVEDVPGWHDILSTVKDRTSEFFLRALKDLISDTSEYGPLKRIIHMRDKGALAFFVASMEGYRRSLYPEVRRALKEFLVSGDWHIVDQVRKEGYENFTSQGRTIVRLYAAGQGQEGSFDKVREFIHTAISGTS